MLLHTQEVRLGEGQDFLRVPVQWKELEGAKDLKTLSWIRTKPTWVEANLFPTLSAHSDQSSSLVLLKTPQWDSTLAIYPVGTSRIMANLRVSDGIIHANLRREPLPQEDKAWVVCVRASGREEHDIVKTVIEEARKLVGGRPKSQPQQSGYWDGIGICSWEAIKQRGDNRATKDTLMSLIPKDPISTFLIDDGWHDVDSHRRLRTFGTWSGFGGTMRQVVSDIKERTNAQVGVWMTLQGYWFGIHPESELARMYEVQGFRLSKKGVMGVQDGALVLPEDQLGDETMYVPAPHKAKMFWKDWLTLLKADGVDYVKAGYDALTGVGSIVAAESMWQSMLEAVVEVFGSIDKVIMCMAHTERMLNGPGGLDFDRPAGDLVFRNSDDYNINTPNAHVDFPVWNLYSSILHGQLSLIPDFDMFASTPADHLPTYHAYLRCLTPGPTLISDLPGDVPDEALKSKVIARDGRGKARAVKTDTAASVLTNRWFWNNVRDGGDGPALVGGVALPQASGALLGAWYCRDSRTGGVAKDAISLRDVEDVLGGPLGNDEYVLWSMGLESGRPQMEVVSKGWKGSLPFSLDKNQVEGFIVAKTWQVKGKEVAVLGMMDKFATLAGLKVKVEKDELVIHTTYETDKLTVVAWPNTAVEVKQGGRVVENIDVEQLAGFAIHAVVVKGGAAAALASQDMWETRITIA